MLKKARLQEKRAVNYCIKCQTVLANEQVEGGACWRCGEAVIQNELRMVSSPSRIRDELYEHCISCPDGRRRYSHMRRTDGKSHGVEVDFKLEDGTGMTIFTTRPDTLYGVTFMVLAPEHPLSLKLAQGTSQEKAVSSFIEKVKTQDRSFRSEISTEKEGVFTGRYAINPLNGMKIGIYREFCPYGIRDGSHHGGAGSRSEGL